MRPAAFLFLGLLLAGLPARGWGFYGHRKINRQAVWLLPPEMLLFYKKHIDYLAEHAVDPDKRRYAVAAEGPRHYIDLDRYGAYPFDSLPRSWKEAVARYGADSLQRHGIVPWWIQTMLHRLTEAFREKDGARILKLSAEIGHYIGDAHVPLHASSNHDGQHTGQKGIHGFWESRVPELLGETDWNYFAGRAVYIADPGAFIWDRVLESAAAADTVLAEERRLTERFPADRKYAFEQRGNQTIRQYSAAFSRAYDRALNGMIGRRLRQSITAVASFWFTAWVNAGQPDLSALTSVSITPADRAEWDTLQQAWLRGGSREH
ncbi:MAG TPA: zinc dependent phospholipase C family protein [Chitinophagaceae bacterium]|nr:zinc dependent phospholipase C family protein [Chitinophagaceae bacterium]